MVAQLSIVKESGEHRKGAHGERLIDEWFLPLKRFRGGTTGQRILAN